MLPKAMAVYWQLQPAGLPGRVQLRPRHLNQLKSIFGALLHPNLQNLLCEVQAWTAGLR